MGRACKGTVDYRTAFGLVVRKSDGKRPVRDQDSGV
jgi:hypothetical protein